MSEQESKWVNLHPVMCAPPTQAELDSQRRRATRWWFGALGVLTAVELVILWSILRDQTSNLLGGFVMFFLAFMSISALGTSTPWSGDRDWSPVTGDDLPRLREVFDRDVLAADVVEQYRRDVTALQRPLVRRDLRIIGAYRQAVHTWIAQEASARELAMFNVVGERNRNLEA